MAASKIVGPWRTSTYSNQQTACVEIAPTIPGGALVRDTKHRHGGHLTLTATAWASLITAAKTNHLDR